MTVQSDLKELDDASLLASIESDADEEAIKELESRAANGRPNLYAVLSGLYSKGQGAVEKDCDRALMYLYQGIGKGSTDLCPLALANCYYFGECVEKDYAKAFSIIYNVAINEEDCIAASRLALMYEWGHGCEPNLELAAQWMYVAWQRGSIAAIGQYARILIRRGERIRGYLIRILAFMHLPLILFRGFGDPRNRVW